MTLKEIEDLVALARRTGILKIKTADIELELAPAPPEPMDPSLVKQLQIALASDVLSDEDAVFFSAPQVINDEKMAELTKRMSGG